MAGTAGVGWGSGNAVATPCDLVAAPCLFACRLFAGFQQQRSSSKKRTGLLPLTLAGTSSTSSRSHAVVGAAGGCWVAQARTGTRQLRVQHTKADCSQPVSPIRQNAQGSGRAPDRRRNARGEHCHLGYELRRKIVENFKESTATFDTTAKEAVESCERFDSTRLDRP